VLRYVALQLTNAPILIAGAYRREELTTNSELQRTVEELDRRRLLRTVRVGPLSDRETDELLAGLVGRELPGLGASIHRQSEGNPFFIEEVVRSIAEEGGFGNRRVLSGSLPCLRALPP
jgi:predicted ATPase